MAFPCSVCGEIFEAYDDYYIHKCPGSPVPDNLGVSAAPESPPTGQTLSDSELAGALERLDSVVECWPVGEAARRLRSHDEDIKRAYQAGFDFANLTRKEE